MAADYDTRKRALDNLSDDELYTHFWQLTDQIVQPLVDYAERHTTPSIERSVLLRMGFSSLQAQAFVERCIAANCLGHGAGALIIRAARHYGVDYQSALARLMEEPDWQRIGVLA